MASLKLYENTSDTFKSKINFTQNVLSFLIEGRKEIFNGQSPSNLSDNEFALITTRSCLMTEKTSSSILKYRSVLLFFNDKILETFLLKHSHLITDSGETYQEISQFEYDQYSTNFRASLLLLIEQNQSDNEALLQAKFNEIMLYLLRHEPKKINKILARSKSTTELTFRKVIENNLFSNLDLEELAFISNMSLSTFKRHFKKYYHISPQKYFQQEKLNYSKFLLQKGASPTSLFQKCGYQTLSNFIKAYKAQFGETPGNNP